MNRVFHHRISIPDMSGILVFAALTFYFFWQKQPLVALPLAAVWVVLVERVLHTSYRFEPDGLRISRGRFAREEFIPLASIHACHVMRNCFGLVHYLLIEHGEGRMASVQPACENEFMEELKKRTQQ